MTRSFLLPRIEPPSALYDVAYVLNQPISNKFVPIRTTWEIIFKRVGSNDEKIQISPRKVEFVPSIEIKILQRLGQFLNSSPRRSAVFHRSPVTETSNQRVRWLETRGGKLFEHESRGSMETQTEHFAGFRVNSSPYKVASEPTCGHTCLPACLPAFRNVCGFDESRHLSVNRFDREWKGPRNGHPPFPDVYIGFGFSNDAPFFFRGLPEPQE